MRALHIVKTSEGARWAALQTRELVARGVDVHVALPKLKGRAVDEWRAAGAHLHEVDCDLPAPWNWAPRFLKIRELVEEVWPEIIQTYHVGPTLALRMALGRQHPIPRVYWVAGPLHLEHPFYRRVEIGLAGANDRWICTSRCIRGHYERAGIDPARLYLSYAGTDVSGYGGERTNALRDRLGISRDALLVGNISYIYPPKYHLGQTVGLKCHEDLIDALGIVIRQRPEVVGLLAGGTWGGSTGYEEKLRARAKQAGVLMPGRLELDEIQCIWPDFDCAIHVPLSENCGGALEPLLCGVPVIAGNVGGLPELVMDDVTGCLVPVHNPKALAAKVLEVLDDLPRYRRLAKTGQALGSEMFDVRRTGAEVYGVYAHVLQGWPAPEAFDSRVRA
jgi:glycosyltransferase involved in cell wall biosynthesis